MIAAIALGMVVMLIGLAILSAMVALAIRRDVRERFDRLAQRLEDEALTLVQELFPRP